jgi:hypothetical protein
MIQKMLTRSSYLVVKDPGLYLSHKTAAHFGDSTGNRTPISAVKGPCPNR